MKIMAAADIHGSRRYCAQLVAAFAREGADKLLLLGDILSLGEAADNADPGEKDAAELLNGLSPRIVCVRGNCDLPGAQDRLDFPCLEEYALLRFCGSTIFATHGHRYNEQYLPPIPFDIFLQGHTHVPAWREHEGYLYLNPGSVSRPRGGSKNSYLVLMENTCTWKDLEGNTLFCYNR